MMGYGWGMGGGFGMILFWIVLVLAIVWLFRALDLGKTFGGGKPPADGHAGKDSALEVLRERYARGEVDSDEFERRKRDLENR